MSGFVAKQILLDSLRSWILKTINYYTFILLGIDLALADDSYMLLRFLISVKLAPPP